MVFFGGTFYCCLATAVGRHISMVQNQNLWKTYVRATICAALFIFCIAGKYWYCVRYNQRVSPQGYKSNVALPSGLHL